LIICIQSTMKLKILLFALAISHFLFFNSCDSGPRVIESETTPTDAAATAPNTGGNGFSFQNTPTAQVNDSAQPRTVEVIEVLNTARYTYLRVKESADEFWIAISKREVQPGEQYQFTGGLLKKNFYSQEFKRQFETLYLVSNLVKQGGGSEAELDAGFAQMNTTADLSVSNIKHAAGAVRLEQLFSNKTKYANKEVLVTGKCVKVNPMIMNRNWIHLQDGTGKELDLTITTVENIALGQVITLKGVIALDKDFGAGYRYDIIMEGATVQ
jgi:hypothetical protein